MSVRRGFVSPAVTVLVFCLTAGSGRGHAVGGLDRAGLTRFLCEALRTDNVPVAMGQMDSGFFATPDPVALRESIVSGDRHTTHTFVRSFFGNEIKYTFNEPHAAGEERGGFSLAISQDAPQGVWFQQLPEARAWLEAAGLATRPRGSGIEGYAPGSRNALGAPSSTAAPAGDGFSVYVTVFNEVEVRWSRPDLRKFGQGFCGP